MAAIYGDVQLQPIVVSAEIGNEALDATAVLQALTVSAQIESEDNRLVLAPIEVAATILTGNAFSAAAALQPLDSSGVFAAGTLLNADLTLRPLDVTARIDKGAFDLTLEPLDADGSILAGNVLNAALTLRKLDSEATILANTTPLTAAIELQPLVLAATFTQNTLITASLRLKELALAAQMYSGNVFSAQLVLPVLEIDGNLYPQLRLAAALTLPLLVLQSTIDSALPAVEGDYAALSLNLEGQKALTRADGWPFNSFAKFNGVYLAAGAGGIFALAGDDDAATAIDAVIRSGQIDFGSKNLKRIRAGYINYRTNGTLVLKLTTDEGESYEYMIERIDGDALHSNRIKLGRGMIGRHFQWEVRNVAGADFDINDITLLPQELPRKFK